MNPTTDQTASDVKNDACPLASLVLLATAHRRDDAPELLEPLGISQGDVDAYAKKNASSLETIKGMAIAGALLDRKTFASLMRVRVGVKLIETEDPRQLAVLVTAAAKLPAWVFGEEAVAKPASNGLFQNGAFPTNGGILPQITALGMQNATAKKCRPSGKLTTPRRR